MKRRLLIGSAAAMLLPSYRSEAVIVTCVNCSTIYQQLQDAAVQAKQLGTQALQYETELKGYLLQVQQAVALPMSVWSNVTGDLNQVRNLANAASLLTGNSGSIIARLSSAGAYADQAAYLPQNVGAQFTMWQTTFGNAANSLGRTLAVQQQQQLGYAAQQTTINAQAQAAVGQQQAIQAGVEMSSLISTQLNQVQATLTAAAQEAAARDLVAADRQAAQDAATQQFLSAPDLPTTGWARH